MDKNSMSKFLRTELKRRGFLALGWKVFYIGNILTATCSDENVSFREVWVAKSIVEVQFAEQGTRAHISGGDEKGTNAIINWAR
jgi:hypothetical protein